MTSFVESHVLPYMLPLLLGLLLAVMAAYLIINQKYLFLLPVIFIVPVVIIFIRYPFVAVPIWLLVFPFFLRETAPGSRYVYWIIYRAMLPGALGIAILSEFLRRGKNPFRLGLAEFSMLLFLVLSYWNIIMLDQDPVQSLIHFYDRIILPFCMYLIIRITVPTEKQLQSMVLILPLVVLSQSTIGLLSWFKPSLVPGVWLNRLGERTVGTFGNPAVFTTTLVFCVLFLFQYAMVSKSSLARIVCFSLIALSIVSIFFSFSRGSWLGAFIFFSGLFYLYPRVMYRISIVCLLIFSLAGIFFFRNFVTFAEERLTQQNTAEGRIIGDAATLRVIESHPIFGVGYENQELYDEQYRERTLGIAANRPTSSHSTYLLLISEMGVTGFIFYIFPLFYWWRASRKAWHSMPEYGFNSWRMLAMLWLLILDHIAVSLFTDIIQSNLFGTAMWWLTLGMIASLTSQYLIPAAVKSRRAVSSKLADKVGSVHLQ